MNSRFYLIAVFLLTINNLFAQKLVDDTQNLDVLVFENTEKQQIRFIKSGAKIQFRLYSNPKLKYKGIIEKITEKSMYVDGQEIKLSDCNIISGRVRTEKEIIGGILMGMGMATAPFGAAIINMNNIVGPIIIGTGIAILSTGIYLVTSKKKFDMGKGWTVHGGKLSFNRAQNQ